MLHRHGALSCWDYATAGPYLPIDMAGKDAVFLSPHKFVGGPGTPGVLVAKRALLRNRVPSVPGGGTILFVSPTGHAYHPDPEVREEGGTPAIVESIRAGLVFALKEAGRGRGDPPPRAATSPVARWRPGRANPNIEILGDTAAERLPIVSLGMRHPPRLLHGNFVVALLSDLFGIQARSGCFCAGPVHPPHATRSTTTGRTGWTPSARAATLGAKLAFARLGFNYFISEAVFEYILEAVHLLADAGLEAAAAVPLRSRPPVLWRHRDAPPAPTLADAVVPCRTLEPDRVLARHLAEARRILKAADAAPSPAVARDLAVSPHPARSPDPALSPEFERIRWFPLPGETR